MAAEERPGDDRDRTDWGGIAGSTEMRRLTAARRRIVLPSLVLGLGTFLAFLILSAYAHDFMGKSIYKGLTVAYLLALVEIAIVWIVTAVYIRSARSTFDPLAEEAIHAGDAGRGRGGNAP